MLQDELLRFLLRVELPRDVLLVDHVLNLCHPSIFLFLCLRVQTERPLRRIKHKDMFPGSILVKLFLFDTVSDLIKLSEVDRLLDFCAQLWCFLDLKTRVGGIENEVSFRMLAHLKKFQLLNML